MGVIVLRQLADVMFQCATESIRGREGVALWTLRKLRKNTSCAATGKRLSVGERHYGPVGNMDYRGWRVSREWMESQL